MLTLTKLTNFDLFLEKSGLICNVLGYVHPSRRVHSHLLYFPSSNGDRDFQGITYEKYRKEKHDLVTIAKAYVNHNFREPCLKIPIDNVVEVFSPHECMKEKIESLKVKWPLRRISEALNVPTSEMGLVGSRAIGLESSARDSDLDLLICGKQVLLDFLLKQEKTLEALEMKPPPENVICSYAERYSRYHGLPFSICYRIFEKDRTKLYTKGGRKVSFIFTYKQDEIPRNITEISSREIGELTFRARVVDAFEGHLYPRRYIIDINGDEYNVWTHFWLFKDVAEENDSVEIRGNLRAGNVITLDKKHHYIAPLKEAASLPHSKR